MCDGAVQFYSLLCQAYCDVSRCCALLIFVGSGSLICVTVMYIYALSCIRPTEMCYGAVHLCSFLYQAH